MPTETPNVIWRTLAETDPEIADAIRMRSTARTTASS